jgi:tRNA-guanine family transglycosylase
MVACSLVSIHNIHFMNQLMQAIRDALLNDTLDACEKEWCHSKNAQ